MLVPDEDKRGMRVLELRLQKLREQLAAFDKKYTREYLALNPTLNTLPKQIKELEKEIKIKRNYGKSIVLSDAEQNYEAAKESLYEIKKQLEKHKRAATEFSSRFAEHEALLSDVEGLELLQRTTQERLAKIEAKQAEKFPQVKVIERAFLPREPFSPDYTRDAIIAVVSSIIFGLLCVWIIEFLTRKEGQNASITISGINMYNDTTPDLLKSYQQGNEQLTQNSVQSLQYERNNRESDNDRELSDEELRILLEASDIKAKQLVALLLSGLTLDEISKLRREHIDFAQESITVTGENQRIIPMNKALRALFEHIEPCPTWDKNQAVSIATLEAILVYAVVDSGLTEAQEITATCISNAYILYLVKQGIRLSELEKITGYIDPTDLSKYSRYSPEKRGLPISDINRLHPALAVYIE
jgi:integrase